MDREFVSFIDPTLLKLVCLFHLTNQLFALDVSCHSVSEVSNPSVKLQLTLSTITQGGLGNHPCVWSHQYSPYSRTSRTCHRMRLTVVSCPFSPSVLETSFKFCCQLQLCQHCVVIRTNRRVARHFVQRLSSALHARVVRHDPIIWEVKLVIWIWFSTCA